MIALHLEIISQAHKDEKINNVGFLKALVDGGQVRVESKARGTAYVWLAAR